MLRERLARVEGGHDHLSSQVAHLGDKVDSLSSTLARQIADQAQQTRTEIREHVDAQIRDMRASDSDVNKRLSSIEGGIHLVNWSLIAGIALITGLLGWGQIGDWAWSETGPYIRGAWHLVYRGHP